MMIKRPPQHGRFGDVDSGSVQVSRRRATRSRERYQRSPPGEQAAVSDATQALWQIVDEKVEDELEDGERHPLVSSEAFDAAFFTTGGDAALA